MTRLWHFLVLILLTVSVGCRKPAAVSDGAAGVTAAQPESPAASAQPATGSAPAPASAASGAAQPASAAAGSTTVKPVPAQLPAVLATVNGERVERWELENAVRGVEAVHGGTPMPPDQRDGILRGLLDQIIAYHLIGQEASARKMGPTPDEVNARMAEMRGQYPDEAGFQQALKNMGVTLEQVQRQTRLGIAVEKMISIEVTSKVAVSDGDVAAFYQQNLERFKQGEAVHASHILKTAGADADAPTRQKAREEAKRVLQQLQKGADFATLAREQSQDPGTAPGGGDLGFFPKGQTDPAFEAAAFALKPGGLSDVVESAFGFHIIKVHERRGPRTEPFAEVSGQIKEFLAGQQHASRLGEFVDRVKARSKIEIFV
ncbi:MAG: hypothetical protein DMF90_26620 [Acidobacteria bacterium]|nr:MAG: hypothetical protein DMF90_26620 [Acidobacteriota bacterium]